MSDRVFCIDFGTAYTKVALRREPSAKSDLVSDPSLALDDLNVCIPTVVALDRRNREVAAECGMAAANRRTADRIQVFRNWKKDLFGMTPPSAPAAPRPPGLGEFLASPALRELAAREGVTEIQLGHLRGLVAAATALAGGPPPAPAGRPRTNGAGYLADKFFTYLREFVLTAAGRLGVADADRIPVRVAVPAFAQQAGHPAMFGCQVLEAALKRAGWRIQPERGLLTEPYANAIGVLTRAANVLQPRGRIHFGKMFHNGPLITAIAEPRYYPAYRAVVIDVGAFTTDFAALTLRTDGQTVTDPDGKFEVVEESIPVGVSNLDDEVVGRLGGDKGRWLGDQARPIDWEDFRQNVYAGLKAFTSNEVGKIGVGVEKKAIQDCVAGFTAKLAAHAATFCGKLDRIGFQELILTGGGNGIPAVRDGLLRGAQPEGVSYRKVHTPGRKPEAAADAAVAQLDQKLIRGGTALGGASIYFEPAYNGPTAERGA